MTDTANTAVETTTTVRSRRGRRIMGLVLVVLVILLGLSSFLLYRLVAGPGGGGGLGGAVSEDGLVWVRSIYGMSDAEADQLDRAQAAVPGPDGSIWVTTTVHGSLLRFTSDGRYVSGISPSEELTMVAPSRFAIDTDGTFYVCDTSEDMLRVIDADGTPVANIGVPAPVSVDVDEEHIVVGSLAGFAILNKENGEPLQVIGSRGKGDDQFDYVHGVAISEDGSKVFVTDAYNNRISAWDKDGNRLWIKRLGTPQNSAEMVDDKLKPQDTEDSKEIPDAEKFQLPLNLTVDGAGRVVVLDMFDGQIAVFDPDDGSFIARYGEIGQDDGKFMYPQTIAYDAERDWFTVADSLNNRVQVVRIPGSAGANAPTAAVQRVLSGPLRACLFPLALLLLAVVVWVTTRTIRKRSEQRRTVAAVADGDAADTQ